MPPKSDTSKKRGIQFDNSVAEPRRSERNRTAASIFGGQGIRVADVTFDISQNLNQYGITPEKVVSKGKKVKKASKKKKKKKEKEFIPRAEIYGSNPQSYDIVNESEPLDLNVFEDIFPVVLFRETVQDIISQVQDYIIPNNNNNNNNSPDAQNYVFIDDLARDEIPMNENIIEETANIEEDEPAYVSEGQYVGLNLDDLIQQRHTIIVYRHCAKELADRQAIPTVNDVFESHLDRINYNAPTHLYGTSYTDRVTAYELSNCLDISNMKHEFNGKFHCLALFPRRFSIHYINEEENPDARVMNTLTAGFKIMTIHNSSFAQLSFTANNFEHNLLFANIEWIIPIVCSLLETGALAGYNKSLIFMKFHHFTIFLNSSSGVLSPNGVIFKRINLGPFEVKDLFRDFNDNGIHHDNFDGFFEPLIEKVREKWDAALLAQYIRYNPDDEFGEKWSKLDDSRNMTIDLESCHFKFFPRTINPNTPFPVTEVTQIQPHSIRPDNEGKIIIPPIPLQGDAPFMKLNPSYMIPPLANDASTLSQFRLLPNNTLMSGMNPAVLPFDGTGDGDITGGYLNHYVMNAENRVQTSLHAPQESTIVPPIVVSNAPPRKQINFAFGPDQLNNILFALPNYEIPQEDDPNEPSPRYIQMSEAQIKEMEEARALEEFREAIRDNIKDSKSGKLTEEDYYSPQAYHSPDPDYSPSRFFSFYSGCILDKNNKLDAALLRKGGLWEPPSIQDTNCFLRCLDQGLLDLKMMDKRNSFLTYSDWRTHFGITHDEHLGEKEYQIIADSLGVQLIFYTIEKNEPSQISLRVQMDREESQIIQFFQRSLVVQPQNTNYETFSLYFLLHKNHAYLITKLQQIIGKVKCKACSQWIVKANFNVHTTECFFCTKCSRSFKQGGNHLKHTCKDISQRRLTPSQFRNSLISKAKLSICQDWTALQPLQPMKKLTHSSKMWFADFEAFPNSKDDQFFTPYAVGLCCLNNLSEVRIFYGEKCMEEYLQYLTQYCDGNLYYYNGAKFDAYLHLKGMVDYGYYIDPKSFVKMGGKILTFSHSANLKVYDLYLFTQSSLKKACKAWGVPKDKSKKEFDHEKIKSFEDADQHREEVTEYLTYDCISLATLFKIYQQAMFECFSMDMSKCITPASFALKTWITMIDCATELYIPHTGKEEDDDRAAYYGGRVMCQYKEYQSKNWESSPEYGWDYDLVEDYIVIGDVNSLYPAVQHSNNYAYGKWKYISFQEGSDDEQKYRHTLNNISTSCMVPDFWITRCFLVDIQCPKNLITSFLMERDEKGEIIHNLEDKKSQWYWGCELEEALILGYVITRVYEFKVFEKNGPIFKSYIDKCWNERKKHPSGTAKNLCFKFAMNGLTGKFGQKSHKTNTVIYSTSYKPNKNIEKKFNDMLTRVVDFEPFFATPTSKDKVGQNAILLEILQENISPSYPIYLSAQILAYARVHMSRIMRACNAYTDPAKAIYYTDTDSLVLPSSAIPDLSAAGFIGKGLGQLKCDLNEQFTTDTAQFAKIVRGVWAATKGPYSLVYLLPGTDELKEKIKVKGIPHIDEPVKYHDPVEFQLDGEQELLMERVKRWLEQPLTYQLPGSIISKKFYLFQSEDKKVSYYAKNINHEMIRMMMSSQGSVYAYYGGMKKEFRMNDGHFLMVRPTAVMRTVCKTDWWSKGKRIYLQDTPQNNDLSFPVGYIQES